DGAGPDGALDPDGPPDLRRARDVGAAARPDASAAHHRRRPDRDRNRSVHGRHGLAAHPEDRRHQSLGAVMVIFLFVGVVLAGAAVALFARSLAFGHVRRREMLAQISAYGFSGPAIRVVDRPGLRQLADRGATALGKLAIDRKSTRLNSSHQIISYA